MAAVILLLLKSCLAQDSIDEDKEKAISLLNPSFQNSVIHYFGSNEGYGIKATSDIHYGDPLFVLPFQYILTSFDYYPWTTVFEDSPIPFRLVPRLIYEYFANPNSGIKQKY
jgi:hypothetical protein